MSTTIDAAGRLVVPKAVRDAMGLQPGTLIDVTFVDGRIQIEFAPLDAHVDADDWLPRIIPRAAVAALTDDDVRATVEATRR